MTDVEKAKDLAKAIGDLFPGHQTNEIALGLAIALATFTRVAKHATLTPDQQIMAIANLARTVG